MEAAESLAGLAVLVTVGSFVLGFLLIVSIFIMAFNISSILKHSRIMSMRQGQLQTSLDKIVRLMEEQLKEKA